MSDTKFLFNMGFLPFVIPEWEDVQDIINPAFPPNVILTLQEAVWLWWTSNGTEVQFTADFSITQTEQTYDYRPDVDDYYVQTYITENLSASGLLYYGTDNPLYKAPATRDDNFELTGDPEIDPPDILKDFGEAFPFEMAPDLFEYPVNFFEDFNGWIGNGTIVIHEEQAFPDGDTGYTIVDTDTDAPWNPIFAFGFGWQQWMMNGYADTVDQNAGKQTKQYNSIFIVKKDGKYCTRFDAISTQSFESFVQTATFDSTVFPGIPDGENLTVPLVSVGNLIVTTPAGNNFNLPILGQAGSGQIDNGSDYPNLITVDFSCNLSVDLSNKLFHYWPDGPKNEFDGGGEYGGDYASDYG